MIHINKTFIIDKFLTLYYYISLIKYIECKSASNFVEIIKYLSIS